MKKTFTYQFQTDCFYIESSDEYDYEYDEYIYTVEDNDLKDAIIDELFYTYFMKKGKNYFSENETCLIMNALKNFIDDYDIWEDLADDFENELKADLENKAFEEYRRG